MCEIRCDKNLFSALSRTKRSSCIVNRISCTFGYNWMIVCAVKRLMMLFRKQGL